MMITDKNCINQRGFTLVEMLIYIAIIGGVAATFIGYSLNISAARAKTYEAQEVHANARLILNVVGKKIMTASGVNTVSSVFGSDSGILVLNMDDSTKNPTTISLSPSRDLQIKEGGGAAIIINSAQVKITKLIFTNLTASSSRENIKINMTVATVTSTDSGLGSFQDIETAISVRK